MLAVTYLKRCCTCCSVCCTSLLAIAGLAVATLVFWPYQPFPESGFPRSLDDMNFTPRHIEVETGVNIFVAERPGADASLPPIVFLHGIMDSWRSFEHLWPRLDTKRRFIAMDFRGHGDSSKPRNSSYSIERFMADVDAVLKALQVEKIGCLVGHSLGSLVGWRFAGTWPTRVERLVLIGTTPYTKPGDTGTFVFKVMGSMLSGMKSAPRWFAEINSGSNVVNTTDMGDVFFGTSTYQTMKWAPYMLAPSVATWGASLHPSVAKPIISSIEARTVIISGESDSVFPPSETKPIMKLLHPKAKASMHVVPLQAHAVHWTRSGADVVAANIADVLADRPVPDVDLFEQLPARADIHTTWMSSTALPFLALPVLMAGLIRASRMMRLCGALRFPDVSGWSREEMSRDALGLQSCEAETFLCDSSRPFELDDGAP